MRPLILELNDTKAELLQVVNTAVQQRNIPCYLLEPFVSELLAQIRKGAEAEMESARDQYEQQMKNTEGDKDVKSQP